VSSAWRTACEVVGVLILIGAFALWERHQGSATCVAANVAAVATEVAHNAAVAIAQTSDLTQEAKTYAAAIAAPTLPVPALKCVRINAAPRPVSKTAAAQPGGHAPAVLPVPDSQSFDPGPALGRIGQAADAQVTELIDYVNRVCLEKQ